jgi:hypothetical protein
MTILLPTLINDVGVAIIEHFQRLVTREQSIRSHLRGWRLFINGAGEARFA